ncbi:tetratricopeptide repeat-containing sensor histidine kinase [Spirosoma agri]|nr:tetratricopeptide repeat protein [Spirosoma agri]
MQKPQSDFTRAMLLIELGRTYTQLNLDSSWYFLRQAIDVSKRLPNKRILIRAYTSLATTYVVTGEHAKGLAILRQAEKVGRLYPFDSIQLDLQTRLTQVYRIQGNYEQALTLGLKLEKQVDRYPQLQSASLLTLYTELALTYEHQNNDSLALPYYLKANDYALKHKKKKSLIGTLGNLGEYYVTRKDFAKAEQYINESLRISREFNFNHSTAESLRNLGEIKQNQRHYTAAVGYYEQALSIQKQIGAKEFIGNIYIELAQSYIALKERPKALAYVEQSIDLFRQIQSAHYLHKALRLKSSLLEQQGSFKEALRSTRQAQVLSDSLTGLDKQKAIAQIQASFDLERKQNQIVNLKKDLTLQQQASNTIQLELKLAQHQRTFLIVVSLLLLLIILITYINYNKLKQAQQLLRQQKDEIVRQTDQLVELHKTKDQLFSIISHDLRSPLIRLKQDIHQLLINVHSENRQMVSSLTGIEQKTDNVLALLMTLLDWAFVQFKGFQTTLQVLNLADLVTPVFGHFADRLNQKQITVINQIEADTIVFADKQQLGIVLRNLVDNAIKFTPVQGYIRLLTIEHADSIELQIRDTGIGMSPELVGQLFSQPEVRQGTQEEEGTGLGILISQELLSKQKGTLAVDSKPNKGTTVKVTLARPHPADYAQNHR